MNKVEGSMNADEDDTSDSEDEKEKNMESPLFDYSKFQEDEEDIEIFSEKPLTQYTQEKVYSPQAVQPTLVSLMETSISIIESKVDRPALVALVEKSVCNTETTQAEIERPSNLIDDFGIAYQSYNRPKGDQTKQSSVPVITALDDYDEDIANRLLKSVPASNSIDSDDEFDITDNSNCNNEIVEAINKVSLQEVEPIKFDVTISPDSTSLEAPIVLESNENVDSSINVFEQAKRAFTEVAEVYRSGLGDHEISLMETNKVATKDEKIEVSRKIEVILEEDEDAEEEAEKQEETRAATAAVEALEAQKKLESEWDLANQVKHAEMMEDNTHSVIEPVAMINYATGLRYFKSQDLSHLRPNIITSEKKQGAYGFMGIGGGPAALVYGGHETDLELPFLVAQCEYEATNLDHVRMLTSIYRFFLPALSETSANPNWELVGFQGQDPRTDLNRSMKMLSVLQMLSFTEQDPVLARRMFDLSQSANVGSASPAELRSRGAVDNSWPFFCVSIMFTKEALQALRRGELNNLCNKYKSAFRALNDFHRACFFCLLRCMQEKKDTHHAIILAEVRKQCETGAAKLLHKYEKYGSVALDQTPAVEISQDFANLGTMSEGTQSKGIKDAQASSGWSGMFGKKSKAEKFAV